MTVTIYSKPDCVQCNATYQMLTRKSVIDITQDEQAYQHVRTLGYQQVPVVIAGQDHWAGFRPDKLAAL